MKARHIFSALLIAALAAAGGWFAARRGQPPQLRSEQESSGKIYSCSMHPQVRSNKPGKCPFCGMALAPLSQLTQAGSPPGSVMLSSNRINVINVQTAEVQRQPLRRTLRVAGTIEDNDLRHRFISAYVDGRIDRLFVNYVGAEVTEGEPLATFFSPMLLSVEREYLALAKQKLPANLPELHADHERLLAGARLRLKQLGLNETQIASLSQKSETNLHTEILAPMSGTVVARNVYEGQYVKEGEKLFELADFSRMWFKFDAYERDLAWLKIGETVDITTPAAPGKTFTAPITFIDPNINDPTRSAKVRVELANPLGDESGRPRRSLFHRLYAEGLVKIDMPEVLAVPRSAVLSPGSQPIVYVRKPDNAFEQRRVTLGRAGDALWEVLEGLKEGETVVTTGNMLLDAQAQLDSGFSSTSVEPAATALPPLTEPEREAVAQFLPVAHGVTQALTADNVGDYNQYATKLPAALTRLTAVFTNAPRWQALVEKVASAGQLGNAADLASARQAFLPFSMAAVEFIKAARTQEPFKTVKVYKCPMAPKPGQTGYWIQLQGPLRNPFYGSEMIDCGSEVTP